MSEIRVILRGDEVLVEDASGETCTFALQDVAVIGESTSEADLYLDDYWIVFVTRPGADTYEIPNSSEGLDELIAALKARRGIEFECGLVNSTEPRSLVAWPPELAGLPVFDRERQPRAGIWGRILDTWIPTYSECLNALVREFATLS